MGCRVSPCDSLATNSMSPCEVRVGKSSGRANPLDVPDDARNLDVIAKTRELGHERNARACGGGHGARSRPSCAQNHADGGEFVFCLHDGEGRFAIRPDAVLLHVINQRLHQRRRRRNRIPRHDRHARKHGAHRGGGVAIDDDHAGGLVHALDRKWVGLGQGRRGIVVTGLSGIPIEIGGFHLLRELLPQRLLDFSHVKVKQLRHHTDVNHVLDQLAQLRFRADGGAELVVGHGVERQVRAQFVQLQRLVIERRRRRAPAT